MMEGITCCQKVDQYRRCGRDHLNITTPSSAAVLWRVTSVQRPQRGYKAAYRHRKSERPNRLRRAYWVRFCRGQIRYAR